MPPRSSSRDASLIRLIGLFYEAPLVAEGFAPALSELRRALGASAVGLTVDEIPGGSSLVWEGLDAACVEDYCARYFELDPWRRANVRAPVGVPQTSDQLVPRRAFELSEFGGDFCRRFQVTDFQDVLLERSDDRRIVLGATFEQTPRRPADSLALLADVAPHALRAWRLHRVAAEASNRAAGLASALDMRGLAVILLDTRGRMLFHTGSAREILAQRDGLELGPGGALQPGDGLARGLAAIHRGEVWVERIVRPSGRADLLLVFAPPGRSVLPSDERPFGTLHIVDPSREPCDAGALLRRTFGLSRAEMEVAMAVSRGLSAREVSEELGVSYATVRSQLLAVYSKTGATRQSALVRVVSDLSLALPRRKA